MFKVSTILSEMGIDDYKVIGDESEISELGLAGYGPDTDYCTFIADEKYICQLNDNAKTIITRPNLGQLICECNRTAIIVQNPAVVFFRMHNFLVGKQIIDNAVSIASSAQISNKARVGKNNVSIGENVIIEDNVQISDGVHIGNNVIIRSGCIIGGQEFEYKRDGATIFHVEHVGQTIISEGVEIGYNSVVGRAIYPWDKTIVDAQTKIADNTVIGHGAKVGKNNLIGAGTVICGRCIIGDNIWIGPNCSISNALSIGAGSHIGIGSVVINNVLEGKSVFGNPARSMPGM